MRFGLGAGVRRFGDDGRVVLGGDPTALLRLSGTGASVLDATLSDASPDTPAAIALVDRLLTRGVLVAEPDPGDGPYRALDVTVVVPVRDDAEGVARLLRSVDACPVDERPAGVVVVDDGSADPSALAEVVARFESAQHGPDGIEVTLRRRSTSGGPGVARNDGSELVATPLVAFLDADCTIVQGWLGPLLGHFALDGVAMVAPRVAAGRSIAPGRGGALVWGHDRVRSPLDLGDTAARVRPGGRVSYVPSAALVVELDRLRAVGGFDPTLRVGEDVDLVWRIVDDGGVVAYEPRAAVRHEVRPDVVSFVRQRQMYGRSAAVLDQRHPGQVAPARLSRWSAAVAACLLVGGPGLPAAGALVGWTSWKLRDQLDGVPAGAALRLGVSGHWAAVRQLLRASLRVWWPLLVVAAPWSRRSRKVLAAALTLAVVEAGRDGVAARALPIAVLDDVAYGAGVWRGCIRERSLRALLPRVDDRQREG